MAGLHRSYWKRLLLGVQALDVIPTAIRVRLLRATGMTIDPHAFIESGVSIVQGRLALAENCYVNRECLLDCRGGIRIGARTLIAPRVMVLTATHPIMADYPRAGAVEFAEVTIASDVWIGAAATILPGVTIGRGAVIAAGSLVRQSLAGDALYAGTPARKIRDLGRTADEDIVV